MAIVPTSTVGVGGWAGPAGDVADLGQGWLPGLGGEGAHIIEGGGKNIEGFIGREEAFLDERGGLTISSVFRRTRRWAASRSRRRRSCGCGAQGPRRPTAFFFSEDQPGPWISMIHRGDLLGRAAGEMGQRRQHLEGG